MARLFVAVRPPPEVRDALRRLERPHGQGVRWVPDGQWHITLRFLGEADPAVASDRLTRLVEPPSVAVLGPAVGRLAERVVSLPVGGLDDLASAVAAATRGVGEQTADRPFRGHLTLGRARSGDVEVALVGAPVSIPFVVDRVALVESRLEPGRAEHLVQAELPLGPPGEART